MSKLRATWRVMCVSLAVGALTATALPAQAAVSGSAKGGPGGAACSFSVSCTAFVMTCSLGQANDVDASIRQAAVGSQRKTVSWNAQARMSLSLAVFAFDRDCGVIGQPALVSGQGSVLFPPATAYVGALPTNPFVNMTWTMT